MHSLLAWTYRMDLRLLQPKLPSSRARPLHQSQNVVADLFEAHIGALAVEGRESEIHDWVEALLRRNACAIERRVAELVEYARGKDNVTRAQIRKRSREENHHERGEEFGQSPEHRSLTICAHLSVMM